MVVRGMVGVRVKWVGAVEVEGRMGTGIWGLERGVGMGVVGQRYR